FNNLIYIAPARIEAAEQANGLLNGQFVRELSLLELNTEPLAQGVVIASAPGLAEHLQRPSVGGCESFEDFDGGCLAGAIGAEQYEALAELNFKIEPVDSGHVRISFDQSSAAHRDLGVG